MGMQVGEFSPQLQEAVSTGRLDPTKINSRNWRAYDQIARNDPTLDFNVAHGGAQAAANVPFAQKRAVLNALPGNIKQMVDLGTQMDYPDLNTAGLVQKWAAGETNDPKLAAYMGVRNDTLLNLASVMRGVGMSDQAHTAELEAAKPTMSPRALEAWAREQYQLVARRQGQYENVIHPDVHPGAAAPAAPSHNAAPGAAPAAGGSWGSATVVGQ
jgi:predicted O-linked N-acetylglucosamine transferase (SPINDLY family)